MEWYEDEVRWLERTRNLGLVDPPPVAFYGSSSIRLWETLQEDFPGIGVVNLGFGWSTLAACAHFFSRLVPPHRPRSLLVYAGDNDLQDGDSPAHVRDDFAAFVSKARALDPGVPIAFIAIKPSVARKALLPKIREANALVREYAATQQGVTYLDVFTPMLGRDGQPQPQWFIADGLHMNRKGYVLWIDVVKPWLEATLR